MGDVMGAATQRKRVADLVAGDIINNAEEWHRWSDGTVHAHSSTSYAGRWAPDEFVYVVVPEPDYEGFVKELLDDLPVRQYAPVGTVDWFLRLCDQYHIPREDV